MARCMTVLEFIAIVRKKSTEPNKNDLFFMQLLTRKQLMYVHLIGCRKRDLYLTGYIHFSRRHERITQFQIA